MKKNIIRTLCIIVMLVGVLGSNKVMATDLDTIYKNAYILTQESLKDKTQKSVNEAREAVKLIPDSMGWAIGEFSKQIDGIQHQILVSIVESIDKAENEITQTNINNARRSIPEELRQSWKNSYSSAVDDIQRRLQAKAIDLLKIAESEKTQESIDEARLVLNDLKEANNSSIVEWNDILIERLDKVVVTPDLEWEGKNVYLFGDSITSWDNTYFHLNPSYLIKGYPSYIKEELGGNIINKGVSGATITTEQENNIHDVILRTDLSNADIVIITGGTNDKIKGWRIGKLGNISDTSFNTKEYIGSLRSSIHYIYAQNPKVKIYLMSPINMVSSRLNEYGEAMEKVGEIYSIPVLRMDKNVQINLLNKQIMMFDMVHPNNEGYKRMKEVIIPFLKNN